MLWTSIRDAFAYWKSCLPLADPPCDFEVAEAFILAGRPTTALDAACILEVICKYGGDSRCDGLDHGALLRIQSLLVNAEASREFS